MEPSKRIAPFLKESIFEEMRELLGQGNIQNLCSGYTEWDTPQFLKEFLNQSTLENENHYGRIGGQPTLVKAIAKDYSPKLNREIDPETEIAVTHGATGALTNICCAFLNEGDEVIIFEPSFESYFVQPALFGAKLKTFPLDMPKEGSDEWTINFEEFEKLFNEKTRFLILNSPHNPTGKVFKEHEIKSVINIAKKWPRLIIITDEVYEHMCYDGLSHLRLAAYDGMWGKVISMYTGSKVFSCSGWRIGWAIGSPDLIAPIIRAQTWLSLGIHRPTQLAVAKALNYVPNATFKDDKNYYEWLNSVLQKKKDRFVKILRNCSLKIRVFAPEGGFFILADISEMIPLIPVKYYYKSKPNQEVENEDTKANGELKNPDYSTDYAFVRWLAEKYRIACVPCFPFYDQTHTNNVKEYRGSHIVRFALCKNDETLGFVEQNLSTNKQ